MKNLNTLRHYGCRTLTALVALVCFVFTQSVWADNLYFVHTDHLGTPVVITDSARATVWQGDKTPFGETTATVNQIELNVRFPGQYYDQESGLHYNYYRDYDPSLGRYVQSDPIGLRGGLNTYAYVDGNPVYYIDPDGLAQRGAAVGGAAGGVLGLALGASGGVAICIPSGPGALACGTLGAVELSALGAGVGSVLGSGIEDLCTVIGSMLNEAADSGDGESTTLQPGPHAGDSIPARGPGRDFTPEERDKINEIGKETGCHTCGSTDAGTQSGNFVPDHQPPNALNPEGGAQELYPHCLHCSRVQGGEVRGATR